MVAVLPWGRQKVVLQDHVAHDVQDMSQHSSLAFVRGGTVCRHCREKSAGLDSLCMHQNNTLCWDLRSLQSFLLY